MKGHSYVSMILVVREVLRMGWMVDQDQSLFVCNEPLSVQSYPILGWMIEQEQGFAMCE